MTVLSCALLSPGLPEAQELVWESGKPSRQDPAGLTHFSQRLSCHPSSMVGFWVGFENQEILQGKDP